MSLLGRRTPGMLLIAFVAVLATATMSAGRETAAEDTEWLSYNGSLKGDRFSSLAQIHAGNAAELNEVCRIKLAESGQFGSSPVLAQGKIIATIGQATVAIDPLTCEVIWKAIDEPASKGWPISRGAVVVDDRVIRGTVDGKLVAYDLATGRELWKSVVGDATRNELSPSAPIAWNGLVFIGTSPGDFGIVGRMSAFEVATGRKMWSFNLVPQRGEPGNETWGGTSAEHGGGGTWTSYALDPDTGELFVPVANPAPDFDKAARPGANLYTNSVVVLDARSGKLAWYYQARPNDDHDYGITAPPMLYTMRDGRKVVAISGKEGIVYVIDRQTHRLIFKRPIVRQKNFMTSPTSEGVEWCPGALGGIEWNGPAHDRLNNQLIVGAVDWCSRVFRNPGPWMPNTPYFSGRFEMIGEGVGWINAIDATTGRPRWRFATPAPVVSAVAPTAGGIAFAGDMSGTFYVFRSTDGAVLRRFETGGAVAGGIFTYLAGRKQYVAIASGNVSRSTFGATGSPSIIVYGLVPPGIAHVAAPAVAPSGSGSHGGSSLSKGAAIYAANCASCHGANGEGLIGPKLTGIGKRKSVHQLILLITAPPPTMPALFPGVLSQDDVADVAAFVSSMK